jgi:hypothetical protein
MARPGLETGDTTIFRHRRPAGGRRRFAGPSRTAGETGCSWFPAVSRRFRPRAGSPWPKPRRAQARPHRPTPGWLSAPAVPTRTDAASSAGSSGASASAPATTARLICARSAPATSPRAARCAASCGAATTPAPHTRSAGAAPRPRRRRVRTAPSGGASPRSPPAGRSVPAVSAPRPAGARAADAVDAHAAPLRSSTARRCAACAGTRTRQR